MFIKILHRSIKVCFFLFLICLHGWTQTKIRRVILKEYSGGTLIPTRLKNEDFTVKLYSDKGYLKITLIDYRGAMSLIHYSSDSVIQEKGHYINSVHMFRKEVFFSSGDGNGGSVYNIEYYEPRRNGKWLFYDSTGTLIRTEFYMMGMICNDSTKHFRK